ncbi:MAG: GNAT family N-acetyltransferase [Chloroflexota bacterium]|nr:GNAT family N-acetyltransferase [Chloroflexota bacterium]
MAAPPRLLLEPLAASHAATLYAALQSPELYTFIPQDPPPSPHGLEARYAALSTRRSSDGREAWLNWVMRQRATGAFVAWATSRRLSPEQRERADVDWWEAHLTRQAAPRLATLLVERDQVRALLDGAPIPAPAGYGGGDPAVDCYYRQLGQARVARFAYQHSYPADAAIGGATFGQYTAILALLIGWLHRECDRRAPDDEHAPTPQDERTIIAALAEALDADPATIGRALQPFILDRDNAAYHSALPGHAAPPLIFLARELRRRHAREYHNSAHLREGVFRQDLYRLFGDRRFVLSARRVELKRRGAARTDIDALVFDRKTGTLGVFELKAQDPFARSVEERQRQRDNFFHANHQVSAILEWVQRHGPDDLLARFDARAAKRFHVRTVYVFVLGRYLPRFRTNG